MLKDPFPKFWLFTSVLLALLGCARAPEPVAPGPELLSFADEEWLDGNYASQLFVGCDGKSVYNFLKTGGVLGYRVSQDGGKSWQSTRTIRVGEVKADPLEWRFATCRDRDFLFLTRGGNKLKETELVFLSSLDGGQSWNLESTGLWVLESQKRHLRLAAGGDQVVAVLSQTGPDHLLIAVSTDRGGSWFHHRVPLEFKDEWKPHSMRSARVSSLVVDSSDQIHLLVCPLVMVKGDEDRKGAFQITLSKDGVLVRTRPLPGPLRTSLACLAANSESGSTLFRAWAQESKEKGGRQSQIWFSPSQDNGESWQDPVLLQQLERKVHRLDLQARGELLACSFSYQDEGDEYDCVTVSKDGGQTWSTPQRMVLLEGRRFGESKYPASLDHSRRGLLTTEAFSFFYRLPEARLGGKGVGARLGSLRKAAE